MSVNGTSAVTDFGQFDALRAAADRHDPKALRYAAQQFEAMFTEMMLKSAHATQLGDDLTGQQGGFYEDLYDQQLASQMASSGHGLGIADMLMRQLGGHAAASAAASAAAAAAHGTAAGAAAAGGAAVPAARAAAAYGAALGTVAGSDSAAAGAAVNGAAAGAASGTATAGTGTAAATSQDASWLPKSIEDFVSAVRPYAEKAAAALGVPARALIAQAALETGWGQHLPQKADGSGFNLFGIKAGAGWNGAADTHATSEYSNGSWTQENARFRSYGSIGASFDDYVHLLKSNPRYADALRSGDVNGFAQGLQDAGYATDPDYAQKIIRLASSAQLQGALTATASRNV
jgi:flagellar protein FlgJ